MHTRYLHLTTALPLLCLTIFHTGSVGAAPSPAATLTIATLPSENAEVQKGIFGLLSKELGDQLGRTVRFVRPENYAAALTGLARNEIDVALVGAVVYVKARANGNVRAILRTVRNGHADYRGMIAVRSDSVYDHIEDLRGKSIAFVDENSTAGYLYPLRLLKKHNMLPGKDFTVVFAGGHHTVAEQVAQGKVAAGACFEGADSQLNDPDAIKVIAYTDPMPGDPVVVRTGLDAALVSKLTDLFLKLDQLPEGSDFLVFAGIDKFVPAADKDYDPVAKALHYNHQASKP